MTKLLTALVFVSSVLLAAPAFAAVQACLPNPLPGPTAPVFSRDVESLDDRMHFEVWRVPCDGGHALLIRVTPTSTAPFTCSSQFSIVQAGTQYDPALLLGPAAGSATFCDNLLVPVTTVLGIYPGPLVTLDKTKAFQFFFNGPPLTHVDIAAAAGVVAPPPAGPPTLVVVATGCTTCHAGNTLGFELHVTNPGGPRLVELKTGARLPGGAVVSILERHEEEVLPTGVTVIPLFAGLILPPGIPAGAYAIEAALLEPELGVTLSRSSVALTVGP